jgi:hypothetical protein
MTLAERQKIRQENTNRLSIGSEFYCRPRRRRLTMGTCLDDYMNANAFALKRSACWRCPQGCTNRNRYSEGQ